LTAKTDRHYTVLRRIHARLNPTEDGSALSDPCSKDGSALHVTAPLDFGVHPRLTQFHGTRIGIIYYELQRRIGINFNSFEDWRIYTAVDSPKSTAVDSGSYPLPPRWILADIHALLKITHKTDRHYQRRIGILSFMREDGSALSDVNPKDVLKTQDGGRWDAVGKEKK